MSVSEGPTIVGNKIVIPIEVMLQNKQDLQQLSNEIENIKTKAREAKQAMEEARLSPELYAGRAPVSSRRGRVPFGYGEQLFGMPAEDLQSVGTGTGWSARGPIFAGLSSTIPRELFAGVSPIQREYGVEGGAFGEPGMEGLAAGIPPLEQVPFDEMEIMYGRRSLLPAWLTFQNSLEVSRATVGGTQGIANQLRKYIPYISEELLAFGFAELVLSKVYGPGGWLDVRFKRDIPKEFENLFTRQQQYNRRNGIQQVIIAGAVGFRGRNGVDVTNSFRDFKLYGVEPRANYLSTRDGVKAVIP